MFDIVTIGHFVRDIIVSLRIASPIVTLGGPPTFVSLAASKLGAKVSVVSKVGRDFCKHVEWLREKNVDLSMVQIVEDAFTTSFVLQYDGERKLKLKSRAPQMVLKDIPTSLQAKAVHVAPVANEISLEIFQQMRNKTQLLSVDPQGFLREFDEAGNMKLKRLGDMSFLRECDVFKSSVDEIRMATGCDKLVASMRKIRKYGVKVVLVTMGEKGVIAYLGEDFYHIPPCKPKIFKDSTGAGDVFIGAFLAEYIRDKDLLWCCCVGSAAASFVIEGIGPQRFGERDEVYERAIEIYEKGIKPLSQTVA